MEEEVDPPPMFCPVAIALSARDVHYQLQSLHKGVLVCIIRPPHSSESLLVLATAFYITGRKAFFSYLKGTLPYSKDDLKNLAMVRSTVRERISVVGPLARQVLNSRGSYEEWRKAMTASNSVSMFLSALNLTGVNVYKLPREAAYFVAPYTDEELRFLSPVCTKMLRKIASRVDEERLRNQGLEWQIAEGIVLECFVMHDGRTLEQIPEWRYDMWEYFNNPEPGNSLTAAHEVTAEIKQQIIDSCVGHTSKWYFSRSQNPIAIQHLDERRVYLSTMATMPVGEFFTYDKEANRITLYQTSTVDPSKHCFSLDAIEKYSALGTVSVRVLYFVPWSRTHVKALHIVSEGKPLKDVDVSTRIYGKSTALNYQSFIVRCGVYSSLPSVLLSQRPSPLQANENVKQLEKLVAEAQEIGGGMSKEDLEKLLTPKLKIFTVEVMKHLIQDYGLGDLTKVKMLRAGVVKLFCGHIVAGHFGGGQQIAIVAFQSFGLILVQVATENEENAERIGQEEDNSEERVEQTNLGGELVEPLAGGHAASKKRKSSNSAQEALVGSTQSSAKAKKVKLETNKEVSGVDVSNET